MNLPVSALMAVCPLSAAVILVHRAEGSAGVKRLLRRVLEYRRIGWRWYLPVVFLNPAILLGSYGVMRWLGRPLPDPQVSLAAKTLARFRPGLTRPGSSAAPGELEHALPASTRARPGRR